MGEFEAERLGDGGVGDLACRDIEAGAQMLVAMERALRQPCSARASTKGKVALPRAKVEVRATAPGILATQ